MRPIPWVLTLLSLAITGCGEPTPQSNSGLAGSYSYSADAADREYSVSATPILAEASAGSDSDKGSGMGMMGGMMGAAVAPGPFAQDVPPSEAAVARRIIYDAQIDLVVEDLEPSADRLVELVGQHEGYIAEQDLSGTPGSRRNGRWKLRVPVERFEDLVQDVLAMGELQRHQRSSQDVTEEFYDIEARVRNKRVEESTLLEILEDRSGVLEDVLKVEIELSRVRGEIEQLEGRLRVLEALSSLATVTLSLREREDYAPSPPVAPDFGTRIARVWAASIADLRDLGEGLVLFAVGLTPWLPLILIGLAVLLLLLRRLIRALPRLWELGRRPITQSRPTP